MGAGLVHIELFFYPRRTEDVDRLRSVSTMGYTIGVPGAEDKLCLTKS